jgi:hypothetical protein
MKYLFSLMIVTFLFTACKKEDCKTCKYVGLHYIENGGSHSQDTLWRLGYDTSYQTRCSYEGLPSKEFTSYYTYSDSIINGEKVVITWVNKGTWFCE